MTSLETGREQLVKIVETELAHEGKRVGRNDRRVECPPSAVFLPYLQSKMVAAQLGSKFEQKSASPCFREIRECGAYFGSSPLPPRRKNVSAAKAPLHDSADAGDRFAGQVQQPSTYIVVLAEDARFDGGIKTEQVIANFIARRRRIAHDASELYCALSHGFCSRGGKASVKSSSPSERLGL